MEGKKEKGLNLCPECKGVLEEGQKICLACAFAKKNKKKGSFKRFILIFLGVFLVLIGLQCLGQDGPPVKDGDMTFSPPKLDEKTNAYGYYVKASKVLIWHEKDESWVKDALSGKKWDEKKIGAFLKANQKALELFEKGVKCKNCILPVKEYTFFTKLPSLHNWRNLGRIVALKGWALQKAGKDKEALETFQSILSFGNHVQLCQGSLVMTLLGGYIYDKGLDQLFQWIRRTKLKETELAKTIPFLMAMDKAMGDGLAKAFKVEYMAISNLIEALAKGKITTKELGKGTMLIQYLVKVPYFFQPNNTRRMTYNFFRHYVRRGVESKNYLAVQDSLKEYTREIQKFLSPSSFFGKIKYLMKPNLIGRKIQVVGMPNLEASILRKFELQARNRAAAIMIALKCYKSQKGKLPPSLKDLIPQYFKSLPQDPFQKGKTFHYLPKKKKFYSQGIKIPNVDKKAVSFPIHF